MQGDAAIAYCRCCPSHLGKTRIMSILFLIVILFRSSMVTCNSDHSKVYHHFNIAAIHPSSAKIMILREEYGSNENSHIAQTSSNVLLLF